jgi:type IX secretion system PorP/SprF family membrane protein
VLNLLPIKFHIVDSKLKNQIILRVTIIVTNVFIFCSAGGQQAQLDPISYWVFVPYIYNPAIIGSKDYLSIGLNASFQGNSNTQLLSGNTRISKTNSGYFSSPDIKEFKNIGVGGSLFRDINSSSRNIGLSASGSVQIPLNTLKISFLSFGAAAKGVFNKTGSDSPGLKEGELKTFYPDLDLGIYYYGPRLFTGLSVVNVFGNFEQADSIEVNRIPVDRQFFFTAGYKIILSKSLNIVLEPSILVFANDSTINNLSDNISPILKLYMEEFCVGTSFQRDGNIKIFSQFRYPRFFVGAFYEFAKKTPYFKKNPFVEVTLGINIQPDKSRFSKKSLW